MSTSGESESPSMGTTVFMSASKRLIPVGTVCAHVVMIRSGSIRAIRESFFNASRAFVDSRAEKPLKALLYTCPRPKPCFPRSVASIPPGSETSSLNITMYRSPVTCSTLALFIIPSISSSTMKSSLVEQENSSITNSNTSVILIRFFIGFFLSLKIGLFNLQLFQIYRARYDRKKV